MKDAGGNDCSWDPVIENGGGDQPFTEPSYLVAFLGAVAGLIGGALIGAAYLPWLFD
jgi:hypothetical protein